MSVYAPEEAVDRKKKPRQQARQQAPMPLVEFTAAAEEHTEPGFDVTVTPSASSVPVTGSPFEVPPYGYLRHVVIQVTASGGVGGTLAADGPFSAIQEIALYDVNGAPIFGPMSGYQAFLTNLLGGYAFFQDPRVSPDFTASPTAFQFMLRIPIEINHNTGLGALGNQNAAATYKIRLTLGTIAQIWSVAPGTVPAVRFRAYLEAWSQPAETDLAGRPQAQSPPRHGTTQYWTVEGPTDFVAGNRLIRLTRMGNLIRTIVLVARTAAGVRDDALFPELLRASIDATDIYNEHRQLTRLHMAERTLMVASGFPVGVLAFQLSADVLGHAGDGTAELWYPTVQATRFEIGGTWTGTGRLEILTNDVAPAEINPADRYDVPSETGFAPEVGTPVRR